MDEQSKIVSAAQKEMAAQILARAERDKLDRKKAVRRILLLFLICQAISTCRTTLALKCAMSDRTTFYITNPDIIKKIKARAPYAFPKSDLPYRIIMDEGLHTLESDFNHSVWEADMVGIYVWPCTTIYGFGEKWVGVYAYPDYDDHSEYYPYEKPSVLETLEYLHNSLEIINYKWNGYRWEYNGYHHPLVAYNNLDLFIGDIFDIDYCG